MELFRQLIGAPNTPVESLRLSAAALVAAGWAAEADQIVEQALQAPEPNPAVGEVWVDRWVARGQWGLVDRLRQKLDALVAKGEVGQRALAALARLTDTLTQPHQKKLLERVLERYQPTQDGEPTK
jgi:hypothetical protein